MDSKEVWEVERPSTWFRDHAHLITQGARVLDLACGHGRHAVPAAMRGADVVAIDPDEERLAASRQFADKHGVNVTWVAGDLDTIDIPSGFDVLLLFNYVNRARFPDFIGALNPGGWLFCETFLHGQENFGWGPTNPDQLLAPGELFQLISPLGLVAGREVVEVIDNRNALRASVLARRQQ